MTMKHAFVIDDDPDIRLLIGAMLRARAWTSEQAPDGLHALEGFEPDAFDLVVVDYKMPDLSGAQVATRMRAAGYTGPIVIYSAYVTKDLQAMVRDDVSEPVHFVSKTDFTILTKIIDDLDPG